MLQVGKKMYFLCASIILSIFLQSISQADESVRIQVADLREDVRALNHQLGQLRLEVEHLQRDNKTLRLKLEASNAGGKAASNNELDYVKNQIEADLKKQKEEIINYVARQLEKYTHQLQAIADNKANGVKKKNDNLELKNDYPQQGVAYTVKPGETLSKIAKEQRSTVRDIQNANQIKDPVKEVRAGQILFIPQKQ
jgi:LysM repeat protein